MDLNPCIPRSNLGNRMNLFFYYDCFYLILFSFCYVFFCHYYYSANLQIQHYCLYSDSPTLLPLIMPRPPSNFGALIFYLSDAMRIWISGQYALPKSAGDHVTGQFVYEY